MARKIVNQEPCLFCDKHPCECDKKKPANDKKED